MIYDERSKMISSSRGKDVQAKQEGETNDGKFSSKAPSSSSRQWSAFRNPRIVRVSRSFGGKDRHSKVCTIRGLRDRRIRLSVPTAIQLYDLQDRLGLSQPSKVIDWLLDATKNDIDKLPPLQIPQGFGHQFHQQMLVSPHELNSSSHQTSSLPPFFDASFMFMKDGEDQAKRYWDMDVALRSKSKEVERESSNAASAKGKWIKVIDQQQENQDGIDDYSGQAAASSQKHFPIANHSSSPLAPGLLNKAMPFNSYYHWEPSSLSLSQYGNHGFLSTQTENFLNGNTSTNTLPLPSSAHAPHQLFFCPPSTMPSLSPTFPPYVATTPGDNSDSRQLNHFQLLSSNNSQHMLPNSVTMSSPMRPFSLNVNAGLSIHTQDDGESHGDDEDTDS